MKHTCDFSKGRRGRVVAEPPPEPEKVRITIRLDEDLIDYFGAIADRSGGKVGYQTLINSALREYVEGKLQSGKRLCGASSARKSVTTAPRSLLVVSGFLAAQCGARGHGRARPVCRSQKRPAWLSWPSRHKWPGRPGASPRCQPACK